MKPDLWKSLKFFNRSGACIVAKTGIFRVGFRGRRCTRDVVSGGMHGPGDGVRGGKPPQGTGGNAKDSLAAMYLLDTADSSAPRIPPGQSESSTSVQALMHVT